MNYYNVEISESLIVTKIEKEDFMKYYKEWLKEKGSLINYIKQKDASAFEVPLEEIIDVYED